MAIMDTSQPYSGPPLTGFTDPNNGWLNARKGWNADGSHSVNGFEYDANGRPTDPNNPWSLNFNGNMPNADVLHSMAYAQNVEGGQAPDIAIGNGQYVNGVWTGGTPYDPAWGANPLAPGGGPAGGGGGGGGSGPGGGPSYNPMGGGGGPATLGAAAGGGGSSDGNAYGGQGDPGSTLTEAPGNYTSGMNMSDYMNPMAAWARGQALQGLQATYAGSPYGLNSGAAAKGIGDYLTNSSINQAWQPAFQNYMQDKGFNYGVDTGDRAFNYQAQLNDQTIPWQQQMQMAQLGMQGNQGSAGLSQMLAALLSQNTQALGQTQGTGTIGQGNAISGALQQMINALMQQNMMNRIPAFNQPQSGQ